MIKRFSTAFLFIALAALTADDAIAQGRRGGGAPGGAAPQGGVSGSVVDDVTGEPLAFAPVAIHNSGDSSLATGMLTDKDGTFSITGLRPGNYYARVSYVGYVRRIVGGITVTGTSQVSIGAIRMESDPSIQKEVVVSAKKQFVSSGIDRTIYNTDQLISAGGGGTTDLLKNIPAVEVDPDGNVSLRGSQNVVIMINSRPVPISGQALATFLQGLPASSVERIEVIPNPSAKYDPEGMSGIINIVLKQENSRGLSGGVNLSGSTNNNFNGGINLSYGDGPWSLFGSYSGSLHERSSTGTRLRESHAEVPRPLLTQTSGDTNNAFSNTFNASVDYAFDKQHTISLSGLFNIRKGDGHGINTYTERDSAATPVLMYDRLSTREDDEMDMDYRLGYKWVKETSRHELSAELRYSSDIEEDTSTFVARNLALDGTPSDPAPGREQSLEETRHANVTAQIDYMQPFGEKDRFEAGYKGERQTFDSEIYSESFDYASNEFRPDASRNNSFDYERQIHALYLTYGRDLAENLSVQAGVRLEQALSTFTLLTTNEKFDNDYFSVFPSGFIVWRPSEAMQVKASYSRRINRPRIWSLNPFGDFEDPLFRQQGNPYLKPEYIDSYEGGVSYFGERATLSITPYFRRTHDVIRRFGQTDTAGVTILSFANFDVNDSYGADISGTLRPTDWMTIMANASGYRYITDASNIGSDYSTDAFGWNGRVNVNLTLPWDLDMQLSYFYKAPLDVEGGKMGAMQAADAGIQKKLLDNRMRIGLRMSDIFDQQGFNISRDDAQYRQEFSRDWSSRALFLTFSYSFGTPDRTRRPQQQQQQGQDPMDME